MVDSSGIYALADAYLSLHLLAPGEDDIAPEVEEEPGATGNAEGSVAGDQAAKQGQPGAGAQPGGQAPAGTQGAARILPENLLEDFLDEAADMFEDIGELHAGHAGWERALVFGFVDGVLAVANDTWSTYEDSYFESAESRDGGEGTFAELDAAIDDIAADFEGERPWDEATKGYVRALVARHEKGIAAAEQPFWVACCHAFMYGADAAYDMEWKFVVTPAGNVMLTDEDSISEAALAQLEAESGPGKGSLLGRVFDMMGIDLDELTAAMAEEGSRDELADAIVVQGAADDNPPAEGAPSENPPAGGTPSENPPAADVPSSSGAASAHRARS